jgi:hypothetical protein
MTHYLQCSRLNGLLVDDTLYPERTELTFPFLFWVSVEPDASGKGEWQMHNEFDVVRFSNLPANDGALLVAGRDGRWLHQSDANQLLQQRQRQDNDALMRTRLKQWCATQPEGSEEVFLNLGMSNNKSERYQLYLNALNTLKREHGL